MKKAGKIILVLVILLIIGIAISYYYYNSSLKAVDIENSEEKIIDIEEGSSGNKISKILKENELIKNENVFKLYLRINKINDLKAGQYTLNQSMSLIDIVKELEKGGKNIHVKKFTIPEGYELKQIAEKLEDEGLVDKEKFLEKTSNKDNYIEDYEFLTRLEEGQSLEGYLFPSTYEVSEDADEDEIIKAMLSEFEEIYNDNIKEFEADVDLNFNEIVTLASIVERESRREDERALISGVFHNRLKTDMMLQSCATVQYILGERKEVLSNEDTRIPSEYNTYINTGLPPTPISSVSKESLLAAVKPEESEYLYFRSKEDGSGGHVFSKTYEEHLEADPNK